jgi:membrane protein YqaA with SNARE-associated domain
LVYLTLFTLSLLSATLLPMGSEALLLYDISQGHHLLLLLLFATLGNTLGSLINYLLGEKGVAYLLQKNIANQRQLDRAHRHFQKYGMWALLLSWVPIIGDPITLVAGALKYDMKQFIMIVFFAKGMRYIVVASLFM